MKKTPALSNAQQAMLNEARASGVVALGGNGSRLRTARLLEAMGLGTVEYYNFNLTFRSKLSPSAILPSEWATETAGRYVLRGEA